MEGQAHYVNAQGSVHWECTEWRSGTLVGVHNFFNWLLKLTNHKQSKVTCSIGH